MKQLSIIFALLFYTLYVQAQYGNQDSITVPTVQYTETLVKGLISLPADYNTSSKTYPLLINFEGNGQSGTQLSQLFGGKMIATYIKNGANISAVNPVDGIRYDFIVFTPLPTHNNPKGFADWFNVNNVKPMLAALKSRYRVDPTRVYLTGLSAGGFTTLSCLLQDNTVASQIAATVLASAEGDSRFPSLLCNVPLNHIAYWAIFEQGEAFANLNRQYVAGINACVPTPLIPAIKTETPGVDHAGWVYAYDTTYKPNGLNYLEWLLKYTTGIPTTNTITTGTVTPTSFCVTSVSGQSGYVNYSSAGTWVSGNQFQVLLSSPSGLFTNPTVIGRKTSTTGTDTIHFTIPANIIPSSFYKIKVVATNPVVTGTQDPTNLTVTLCKNSISPTATQNISVGANGNTLTVSEGSPATTGQWYDGTTPITGAFSKSYVPNLPVGIHSITYHSVYSSCEIQVISNAVTVNVAAVSSSRHYVTKGADNGVFLNACNGYQYNPGDTFVLKASLAPYSYVTFYCFNNITIINEGGQVNLLNFGTSISGGFEFKNCTHIHLTGTGSADEDGFKISTPNYRGVGVNVYGASSNFEIDHLEITGKNAGMWVKIELDSACNPANQYPNSYLHDFSIHDNYIHNNAAEGLYLGSTDPNNKAGTDQSQHPIVYCHGDTTQPNRGLPPRLGKFHIYNNYFDSNGRAAIQLSDADSGLSEIDHNTALHCGWDPDIFQGNGISLGTYTHAYVHDNYINWTKKDGIQAFGSLNWIDHNTVLHSGNDSMGHTSSASNIFVQAVPSQNASPTYLPYDSTRFVIRNNDLDSNSSGYNIFVETGLGHYKVNGNVICNNTNQTDLVRSGINYTSNCDSTLSYTLVLDSQKVVHFITKHKTFFRDSLIFHHADSVKVTYTLMAGGKVIDKYSKGYKPGAFDDTTTVSVPYDSIITRKQLVDSFYYDTLWDKQQRILYGFNENNFPDYQIPDFVSAIKNVGVNIIRYPGGLISDSSDWQTQNKPTIPILTAMRDSVGCDILFVLNMNTSTLAYQLQMLDSASKLGIPIKYAEFGNEVNKTNAPLRIKFNNSGVRYGDTCAVWAAAIKAVFPGIKLGAWGENQTDSPTWHNDLLSVYTPDALVSHLYPNEEQIIDSLTGMIDTALFAHIINQSFVKAGIDNTIPVWITEYNLSPDHLDELAAGEHVNGLVFMTQELQKRPEIKMLLMHSLEGAPNGAFDIDESNNVFPLDTGIAYGKVLKL